MRCATCDAEIEPKTLGGLCPVCLFDAALPKETEEGSGVFRYDLIQEIARGGMGVVYRAVQHGSQRQVAVKMILAEQAATPGMMERFRAEAEAVATLDHPHILPIYEIGENDGRPFYSMKFANGGTLRDHAADFSQPRDAARLVARIARAVQHAHERGILHRDLKPGNVLLDGPDHTPYVSDFGLARWIGRESRLTLAQSALGTPHYIAPEQAAGDSARLTPAADVYSLGAILYELLTEGPPFVADTPLETLRLSRETEPPSIRSLKPDIHRDLEIICLKCLAKDPAARYGSAAALAQDLERWLEGEAILARSATLVERAWRWTKRNRAVSTLAAIAAIALVILVAVLRTQRFSKPDLTQAQAPAKSIALLPFENLSRDPDNAYFVQGVEEEILGRLGKITDLKVISRTSTQRFKSAPENLSDIGRQLAVANFLEGSIRKDGDRVRVRVQLINAANGAHLWSDSYDYKSTDLFRVESEVAQAVAEKLQARLSGSEAHAITLRPTQNSAAHQAYLKGRYFWNKTTADDLRKAIDYFTQSTVADPNYAPAYAGLADAYLMLPFITGGTPQECYPKAKEAARKALELDQSLAEAHIAYAQALQFYDFDYVQASSEFQRGLELNPNYASGRWRHSWLLGALGKFDEAFAEMKRAVELDPLSLLINTDLGYLYTLTGRYDQAIEQLHRTLEIDPNFYYARGNLGEALEFKGEPEAALAEWSKMRALNDDPFGLAEIAHVQAALGNKAEATKTLNEMLEVAKKRYVQAYAFSLVYAALGQKDEAFRWLEKSYEDHAGADLAFIRVDPFLAPLRGDPRFEALADKIVPRSFAPAPEAPEKSIAVLPFESLGDQQSASFASGVQDEILTYLAKIADLKVTSRTSVMSYASGVRRNVREIGQQLGVAHLLEGSVQRSGNRIRVNAQLIDARSDSHLWAQTYDRDLADVFAIQTEIARAISDQLQAKISAIEKAAIETPPTRDLAAFDLYSRAKTLLTGIDTSDVGKNNLFQAVELLEQAVGRDPGFIQGYCQLALAQDLLYAQFEHTPARLAAAEAVVQAAQHLAPDAGEVHLALARHLLLGEDDLERARAEIALAQKTLPNSPDAFRLAANIDRRQGRWEEGIRNLQRGVELDPRNRAALQQLAGGYQQLRRYPEAAATFDRVLALAPKNALSRVSRAAIDLIASADPHPLRATIDSVLAEDPGSAPVHADSWLYGALCERDLVTARRAIVALSGGPIRVGTIVLNHDFLDGLLARVSGDTAAAHAAFTAARTKQEKLVREQPDYGPAICALGLIDAGLGRKEDALREGRQALELVPLTKDAPGGALMIQFFAIICGWVGEHDLAFEHLERAAQLPGPVWAGVDPGRLRLHPFFDPLRSDPRFERLVATLGPISSSPAPTAPEKSIAVLPFLDLSQAKDQEYFCDGISEAILDSLAQIQGLQVAARTSSFSFKGTGLGVKEIASKLGVGHLLEGSLRRDGNRIRVTVQLIKASDGFHLWSHTYERELQGVFAVQDEITQAVTSALKLKLVDARPARTENTEAYELYLQGVFFSNKSTEEGLRKSLDLFQRSIEKDPASARPWVGIAKVWNWLADAYVPPREAFPKMKMAAEKAVALDPSNGEAHMWLAESHRILDWDLAGFKRELDRTLELDPNSATAHTFLALYDLTRGEKEEGVAQVRESIRLDPLSPIVSNFGAVAYMCAGLTDEALAEAKRTAELDPNYIYQGPLLANIYREKGMYPEAIALFLRAEQLTGQPQPGLAITYAITGRQDEARKILAKLLDVAAKKYVAAEEIASVYVALGEKEEAFKWLNRACEDHGGAIHAIPIRPVFKPLYSEPRFREIVRRIGLDPDAVL